MLAPVRIRHRLMEALLARLARHPDAEGFVLRGGMRMRQLAPGTDRPARDLDLVCRLSYDLPAARRRLIEVLALPVHDGVAFETDTLVLDPIWRPIQPGIRVGLTGTAAGVRGRVALDLLFGLPLWPPPVPIAGLWAARPETLVARKVHVVTRLGRRGWRPKDLADLEVLLGGVALDRGALGEALDQVFAGSTAEAREVFGHPAWWSGRFAAARWATLGGRTDLAATVGAVRGPLLAVLGNTP